MKDIVPKKRLSSSDNEEVMDNRQNYAKSRKFIVIGLLSALLCTILLINRQQETFNIVRGNSKDFIERWKNKNYLGKFTINRRFSVGEQVLIGADNNPHKKLAVDKFAEGKFLQAQISFTNSLKAHPNDPEALIYLNNSLAATHSDSISIGVSVPIGGSLEVAKEILRGVAQAQNEINKHGGVEQDGVKRLVQIQIANDDNNPKVVRQIATSFVADEQIMAVVGHNSSDASIAAAPIYQEGNLVMVSPTSVARELAQAGSYIFRTTPGSRILAETIAEYAVNIRRTKVAVCADSNDSDSTSFEREFLLSLFDLGGEITPTNCDFSGKTFNPDEIPSRAIADGAEALLLIPSVDKINQALEVAEASQNRLFLMGNNSMYADETLDNGLSHINGLVIPAAWHPNITTNSEYNTNALNLWGIEGSWRTASAYDATKAIFTGLSSATSRKELQQTLSNSEFMIQGASGKVSFQGSGDLRGQKSLLIKARPVISSDPEYDFVPLDPEGSNKQQ